MMLESNTEVLELDGAQGGGIGRRDGDDFDDRVLCEWCQRCGEKEMRQSWTADDFEKFRKVNHPAFNWMWDSVKIRNGWARVEWMQRTCEATDLPAIPKGMRHRCHMFVQVGSKANDAVVESTAWWE